MDDKAHPHNLEPQTVTREGDDALGWMAYSPAREQWRTLTPSGALAYHASAYEARLHLHCSKPSRYRPSPRP